MASALPHVCYSNVTFVKSQQPKELTAAKPGSEGAEMDSTWRVEPQSHTTKRNAYRDEKDVLPFLQSTDMRKVWKDTP